MMDIKVVVVFLKNENRKDEKVCQILLLLQKWNFNVIGRLFRRIN